MWRGRSVVVNDLGLVARAEAIQEKGTDRGRFFRGEVDKYTWQDTGSSYLLSEVATAFLWAQLSMRPESPQSGGLSGVATTMRWSPLRKRVYYADQSSLQAAYIADICFMCCYLPVKRGIRCFRS